MFRDNIHLAVAILCVLLPCSLGIAKEPEKSETLEDDARQVFISLFKEYSNGKTGIDRLELLNNWSIRVVSAESRWLQETGQIVGLERAAMPIRSHVARMDEIRREVHMLASQGKVSKAELAAARHLHWMSTKIEGDAIAVMKEKMKDEPPVELPPAKYKKSSPNALVILVDKDGNASIDGKNLSRAQLKKKLQEYVASGKKDGVLIKAVRRCKYKHIAEIGMICSKAECDPLHITVSEDVDTKKDQQE